MFWECGKSLAADFWITNGSSRIFILGGAVLLTRNTCNKYGVSGYPTLKIFRDGEESGAYDGPRDCRKEPELHFGNWNSLGPLFFVVET